MPKPHTHRLPRVAVEHVRRLGDLRAELTSLHLAIIGHPELWGAISAAHAAVEECARIAMRDIDQDEMAALRKARLAKERRR